MIEQTTRGQSMGLAWSTNRSTLARSTPGFRTVAAPRSVDGAGAGIAASEAGSPRTPSAGSAWPAAPCAGGVCAPDTPGTAHGRIAISNPSTRAPLCGLPAIVGGPPSRRATACILSQAAEFLQRRLGGHPQPRGPGRSERLGIDPGHEAAEPLPDLFDGVFPLEPLERIEDRSVGAVLEDPLAGELAAADLVEDPLHLGASLFIDDPWTPGVVAVLGRVGDAVAHVVQAALIHQVDDQLQLVQALEVGTLGLITGLDQGFERHLDQGADAAAEDDLFA